MKIFVLSTLLRALITLFICIGTVLWGAFQAIIGIPAEENPALIFSKTFIDASLPIISVIVSISVLVISCKFLWTNLKPRLKKHYFMGRNLYYIAMDTLNVARILTTLFLLGILFFRIFSPELITDETLGVFTLLLGVFASLVVAMILSIAFAILSFAWKKIKFALRKIA
jgi:hypothetical protein